MKKIIVIISFIISQQAFSQVYLGLSSGVALTKLRTQNSSSNLNTSSFTNLTGFNIEVPALFILNKNLAIQSGIGYINMGSTIDKSLSTYFVIDQNDPIYQALTGGDTKYRLNYLSIPLTLKISVPINKYSLYARGGGYLSYLLYGTSVEKKFDIKRTLDFDEEHLNRMDVGAVLGLGATRELGNGFLFIDAKYMIGLSNLNNSSNMFSLPFGIQTLNNRGLLINAGYMLRLSKAE